MKRKETSVAGSARSAGPRGSLRFVWAAAVLAACSGSVDAGAPAEGSDMKAPALDENGNPLPPGATVGADGTVVDANGNPVLDEAGNPVMAAVPGVDEGGNPGAANPGAANPGAANPGALEPPPDQPAPSECVEGIPGTSQLSRLTKAQYDNTIRDLVGLTTTPSELLAPDTPGSVDQRAWDGYQAAAASVAAQVMADPDARAKAIPCTPSGDGLACAREFIADFGRRAFRRPLTENEAAKFEALYTSAASITETGSFDEIAQVILRAFLVSPSFLTRAELSEQPEGEYFKLNGYEVASRLSYMLWGSMPDEALFAAAAANELETAEQVLEQAKRMLADDKARDLVAAFHERYALMGPGTRWAEIDRDPNLYPAFDQAMVPLLARETAGLFDRLVFEHGASFQDLLTTNLALVNDVTAPLYGLDPSAYGQDLTEATVEGRPGVFTRVGFLTAFSKYDRPSPILRGAFLQKEVLCTEIPAPPPNAAGTPFPTDPSLTNRERTDIQTTGADCESCHHTIVNPTGFALEGFDAIGMVRTMDNERPVDTTASVPIGGTVVDVLDAADLMVKIASSSAGQRCYAERWAAYAYGRPPNAADACVVESVATKMAAGQGYRVLDLVADLTQADSFRLRAIETEVAQ